jgi:hypothetical protein
MGIDPHTTGPAEPPARNANPEALRLASLEKIRRLRTTANSGLWAMALFLTVSIGALDDFKFLPSLPEQMKDLLGGPPPTVMISGLLVLYSFSALVLVLARMIGDSSAHGNYYHVAYLAFFYGFYHLAGSLADNFWAVFASGTTILTLEGYHLWTWCSKRIEAESETLDRLDGKRP